MHPCVTSSMRTWMVGCIPSRSHLKHAPPLARRRQNAKKRVRSPTVDLGKSARPGSSSREALLLMISCPATSACHLCHSCHFGFNCEQRSPGLEDIKQKTPQTVDLFLPSAPATQTGVREGFLSLQLCPVRSSAATSCSCTSLRSTHIAHRQFFPAPRFSRLDIQTSDSHSIAVHGLLSRSFCCATRDLAAGGKKAVFRFVNCCEAVSSLTRREQHLPRASKLLVRRFNCQFVSTARVGDALLGLEDPSLPQTRSSCASSC